MVMRRIGNTRYPYFSGCWKASQTDRRTHSCGSNPDREATFITVIKNGEEDSPLLSKSLADGCFPFEILRQTKIKFNAVDWFNPIRYNLQPIMLLGTSFGSRPDVRNNCQTANQGQTEEWERRLFGIIFAGYVGVRQREREQRDGEGQRGVKDTRSRSSSGHITGNLIFDQIEEIAEIMSFGSFFGVINFLDFIFGCWHAVKETHALWQQQPKDDSRQDVFVEMPHRGMTWLKQNSWFIPQQSSMEEQSHGVEELLGSIHVRKIWSLVCGFLCISSL